MLQTRVQDSQSSADSGLQHNAFVRNASRGMLRKPALVLVFLLTISVLAGAAALGNNAANRSEVPAPNSQSTEAHLENSEGKASLETESVPQGNTDVSSGNVNSVKLESTTNNGVTSTSLEVNGEEVPVQPNATTSVTVDNGNQTVTNVTTQNTQTGGNGFNFNSSTSTSTSSSYSSNFQNIVGGQ